MPAMFHPTVSVIMPAYNASEYIGLAIESVLSQTYPSWELIVVDDGSTDETASIVASYTDERVVCIHQENRGLPAARNAGIERARGEYLGFLDSDDEWVPAFLDRSLGALRGSSVENVVGVYTSHVYIDGAGHVLPQSGNDVVPVDALYSRLLRGCFFPPCVVLVRDDAVRAVGCFDALLPGTGTEDMDLWLRLTRRYAMLGIDEPLARYRVHGNNMSGNTDGMHTNRMAVLAKHFGPPEGDPAAWSEEKQIAYAYRYRASAFEHVAAQRPQRGWALMARAASIQRDIAFAPDTYYRILHCSSPRGYRGVALAGDAPLDENEILARVHQLCQQADIVDPREVRLAESGAYQALALTCDLSGDWTLGRRYQWRAMVLDRSLWTDKAAWRRLAKQSLGSRVGRWLRKPTKELDTGTPRPHEAGGGVA